MSDGAALTQAFNEPLDLETILKPPRVIDAPLRNLARALVSIPASKQSARVEATEPKSPATLDEASAKLAAVEKGSAAHRVAANEWLNAAKGAEKSKRLDWTERDLQRLAERKAKSSS